jgi:ribonuclease HI
VKLIVEADGGSRGNPGPAGYGAVVPENQAMDAQALR